MRALYGQLVYLWLGADEARLARMRNAALALHEGLGPPARQRHRRRDARRGRRAHRLRGGPPADPPPPEEGHLVVLISASPEEIVAPLGAYLGSDVVIATRARLDEHGRYSGELEFYSYGPAKAVAMEELAAARDLRLAACFAYSDSATDLPHARGGRAPDRREPGPGARPHREGPRLGGPPLRAAGPVARPRQHAPTCGGAAGGGLATLVAAAVVWWSLRRQPPAVELPTRRQRMAVRLRGGERSLA
jgi:hypothetical protein